MLIFPQCNEAVPTVRQSQQQPEVGEVGLCLADVAGDVEDLQALQCHRQRHDPIRSILARLRQFQTTQRC